MAKKERFKAALYPMLGGTSANILKLVKGRTIEAKYMPKFLASLAVSAITDPLRMYERGQYQKHQSSVADFKDPIFVLGHWRSGTTYLHTLLSKDPNLGFITTYQGVFPELVMGASAPFRAFMRWQMPKKRGFDNVELLIDGPQEEEFAISNMNPYSYYNFWYFPRNVHEYYDKYIRFEEEDEEVRERWKSDYMKIVNRAMLNTRTRQIVSKNPPHTGRIPMLLEMFPDAKFIFIYRNPIKVFLSSRKLFFQTLPALHMHDFSEDEMDTMIFEIYKRILNDYFHDRHMIPPQNLIEIRFEDLEANPVEELGKIYRNLGLDGYEEARPHFHAYFQETADHQKNTYEVDAKLIERIKEEWYFTMEKWGYDVPAGMKVLETA